MILKTNNGDKEINISELNFVNLMCDLEDQGVDVMALLDDEKRENMKIFNVMRAILAVLVGEKDLGKAGAVFAEHLKNGGTIDDIMGAFTEAMQDAGFGTPAEEEPKKTGKKPAAGK